MVRTMTKPTPFLLLLAMGLLHLAQPTSADAIFGLFRSDREQQLPPQAEMDENEQQAAIEVAEAAADEQVGNLSRAAKKYARVAKDFPLTSFAPDALFRAAQLYERTEDEEKAFEAYQQFIERYKHDNRFQEAVERQFAIANAAEKGDARKSFFGISTRFSTNDVVEMYESIISNAPSSALAAESQFAIGRIYEEDGRAENATAAFQKVVNNHPRSPLAPEAQFRIGEILLNVADRGGKDRTLARASREAFEDLQLSYPDHERAEEARNMVVGISNREASEAYEIARFYERTNKPQAAALYYRDVLRMPDNEFTSKAQARLDALGAAGITPPQPRADTRPVDTSEQLTRERDDYAGPPAPAERSRPQTRLSTDEITIEPPPADGEQDDDEPLSLEDAVSLDDDDFSSPGE